MIRAISFVVVSLLACSVTIAGDLTPPSGPVVSTNRVTIHGPSVSIPFVISEPGSYVLTGNITGVDGAHGIIIDASDVTLDLNGFAVIGVPGSNAGIVTTTAQAAITIVNGSVSSWGAGGISLGNTEAVRISRVISRANGGAGIDVGAASVVEDCTALSNAVGISAGDGSAVRACVARSNRQDGVRLAAGCIATGVNASANLGDGIDGPVGTEMFDDPLQAEQRSGRGRRCGGEWT